MIIARNGIQNEPRRGEIIKTFGIINAPNNYAVTKYFFRKKKATLTRPIMTGTSTRGPITAAKASPELMPKMAIATAMASSKLLLAAVNDNVVACS